jgi:hypothetical protein
MDEQTKEALEALEDRLNVRIDQKITTLVIARRRYQSIRPSLWGRFVLWVRSWMPRPFRALAQRRFARLSEKELEVFWDNWLNKTKDTLYSGRGTRQPGVTRLIEGGTYMELHAHASKAQEDTEALFMKEMQDASVEDLPDQAVVQAITKAAEPSI